MEKSEDINIVILKESESKIAFGDGNTYFHICTKASIAEDNICRSECKFAINTKNPELAVKFANCMKVVIRYSPITLKEVGDCFGITREMVRQIEEGAKRQLKFKIKSSMEEDNIYELRELFAR